ncbi:MAG: LacI family DNA-binding transcriptional regulator [Candidatus Omnitrophica bacterium]|nr:LacI family DNA-binding transcriptional regulator [Candidatus Omnitrophota bacterium]
MPTTLKDIAKKINVSYSTVSRAINPDTARLVNPRTRKRVLEAVKKYGYVTNHSAAMLRRQIAQAPIIGFTSDQFPHFLCGEYPVKVFSGVIAEAEKQGCDIELFPVLQGNSIELSRQLQLKRNLDGVVIYGHESRPEFAKALAELQIPTVAIGNCQGQSSYHFYVYCDGRIGAQAAVEHLLRLGRRRIAIILGSVGSIDAELRFEGYRLALKKSGIPVEKELVFQGGFNRASGFEQGQKILSSKPYPDAIFCSNDDMAIGLLRAMDESGIRCPEDIAVVGFDDIEQAQYTIPPLTTITQSADRLGQSAVALLLQHIRNPEQELNPIEIPTHLIVRQSCGAYLRAPAYSAA